MMTTSVFTIIDILVAFFLGYEVHVLQIQWKKYTEECEQNSSK